MCDECGGTCGDGRRAGLLRATRHRGAVEELAPSLDGLREVIQPVHRELRTMNATRLLAARPFLVPGSKTGAAQSGMVSSSAGRLAGFALSETTGAAGAVIRLRDGDSLDGDPIMRVNLAAGTSAREWLLPEGIAFTYGLFFEVVSGAVEAVIYLGRDR